MRMQFATIHIPAWHGAELASGIASLVLFLRKMQEPTTEMYLIQLAKWIMSWKGGPRYRVEGNLGGGEMELGEIKMGKRRRVRHRGACGCFWNYV